MKIVLHIGTHKTGTTAIQHFAMYNRVFLTKHGISYPAEQLEIHTHQHSMLAALIQEGTPEKVKGYIERTVSAAKEEGCHTLFLSGEGFSILRPKQLTMLSEILAPFDVEVIILFRNLYDFIISALGQLLKHTPKRRAGSLAYFQDKRKLDYAGLIRRWEKTFSDDQVKVYSYDLWKGDLIPSFFAELGIDKDQTAAVNSVRKMEQNRSIDLLSQTVLAGAGLNWRADIPKESKKIYNQIFTQKVCTPFEVDTARDVVKTIGFNLDHPKLAEYKAQLTKAPKAPLEDFDTLEYLENYAQFLQKLVKQHKRKTGFWGWMPFGAKNTFAQFKDARKSYLQRFKKNRKQLLRKQK